MTATLDSAVHRHRLTGCRPEPLGSYLKALGILRLVGEQADPDACGHWAPDGFVLDSVLDEGQLTSFFLHEYHPTPIIDPWNNSAGFGPEGATELGLIERSTDDRLLSYRSAIAAARRVMDLPGWGALDKVDKVTLLRGELPDECLGWLDAAVVLTEDRVVYPPLLGTGGNDGRLEFSRNFHQRVLDVLGTTSKAAASSQAWLDDALNGTRTSALVRGRSPGQFDPGGASGPNSAPTGAADSLLNPWDWVLLMEGAALLAGGPARRLATSGGGGHAAAPFTVDSSPVGYATAAEAEGSRGELWLPLWEGPTGLVEVRRLFAEGRADWRRRHVRSGLDFVKAAASLGVDRGLSGFSRHALLERNGLSTIAAPVGRIELARHRRPGVEALESVDDWLGSLRNASNLPGAVATALRRADQAVFRFAQGRGPLLDVLMGVSDVATAVRRSPNAVVAGHRPITLDGRDWVGPLLAVDGGRPELRLALSLATSCDRSAKGYPVGGVRELVWTNASGGSPVVNPVQGLGSRPIVDVLAEAHAKRVVLLQQADRVASSTDGPPGVPTRYGMGTAPPFGDLCALVDGTLDEVLLSRLVAACLSLRMGSTIAWGVSVDLDPAPLLFLLAPFYAPQPAGSGALVPMAGWPAALAGGRVDMVVRQAALRLKIAGYSPLGWGRPGLTPTQGTAVAMRLAAALMWPIGARQRLVALGFCCPSSLDDGDADGDAVTDNAPTGPESEDTDDQT